jgi:hypothetical protein
MHNPERGFDNVKSEERSIAKREMSKQTKLIDINEEIDLRSCQTIH